jgi:glycosyltransferase involved in cell wall biosynthesis
MSARSAISVTILTKNEEDLIGRCIDSVRWADEIIVLDSGSTDQTKDIAQKRGAIVYDQAWLGWTPQRQRGIELAQNDWVLIVEADEIVTPELAESIILAMDNDPDPKNGFAVERRDELFGKLLPNMRRKKQLQNFIRLFNRSQSHYNPDEIIHESVVLKGRSILLKGPLLHWRGVSFEEQMRKDIDIAKLEAQALAEQGIQITWTRILLMPILRFLWCYLRMGGFRVGTVGLIYALMRAHSEFLRAVTLWERQSAQPSLDPPPSLWNLGKMPAARASSLP